MSNVILPLTARPAIPTNKYARNGKPVLSDLQQILAERVGQAAAWRQPEVFSACSALFAHGTVSPASQIPGSTLGTRTRWRFAFRTGSYALRLWVRMYVAPPTIDSAVVPYVTVKIYEDTLGATFVGEARTYSYGTGADSPFAFVNGEKLLEDWTVSPRTPITLKADQEYFGVVEDQDYARCIAVSVRTSAQATTTENGWPDPNVTGGGPIFDEHRTAVANMARAVWRGHGAPLFHYSAGVAAEVRTLASGVHRNLLDNASTTVTTATPGPQLDMRNRTTVGRTKGVPVRLRVYASGTAADTGTVRILNSAGATVMDCALNAGSARWYHTDGWLPATDAKYDVHYGGNAASLSVHAVSLYEYNHDGAAYSPPSSSSLAPIAALMTGGI